MMPPILFRNQSAGTAQGFHLHSKWRQSPQATQIVMVDDGQYFTLRNSRCSLIRMVVVRQDNPPAVLPCQMTA